MNRYKDLQHGLIDVRQSVAYDRKTLTRQLEEVVAAANGERCTLPSELLIVIADFWQFDPAHLYYDFGGYVYSLLTENPVRFSDQFIGYEWNADECNPEIDILIRPVAAPA